MAVVEAKELVLVAFDYSVACIKGRKPVHEFKLYLERPEGGRDISIGGDADLIQAFAKALYQMLEQIGICHLVSPVVRRYTIRVDEGEYSVHLFWQDGQKDSMKASTGKNQCRELAILQAFSNMCQRSLGLTISIESSESN